MRAVLCFCPQKGLAKNSKAISELWVPPYQGPFGKLRIYLVFRIKYPDSSQGEIMTLKSICIPMAFGILILVGSAHASKENSSCPAPQQMNANHMNPQII